MQKLTDTIKGAYGELQKVEWPSTKDTIRLTLYVIGASLGVGILVLLSDQLFKGMLSLLIK